MRCFLFNLDSSSAASLPRNKANEFGCMTRPHILATSLNCWLNGTSRRNLLQSTTEQLQLKQCTCTFLTSFVKKRCDMKAFDLIRNRAKCMICTYLPYKIFFRKSLLSLSLRVVKEQEVEGRSSSKVRLRGDNNNRNSFLSKFTTPF